MNFKQLTFLLFIGADVTYSDMAHAMNNDDEQKFISPLAIVRQLNELQGTVNLLTGDMASLKQQLNEQKEEKARMTEQLEATQTQLNLLTESFRSLLTPDAPAPSNP